jgi:hypothetical protein
VRCNINWKKEAKQERSEAKGISTKILGKERKKIKINLDKVAGKAILKFCS